MLTTENQSANLQEGGLGFKTYNKSTLPRKIQALLDHAEFEPKLSWIAKKLDVSIDETHTALELLESLKIISWDNGVIKKMETHTSIPKHLENYSSDNYVSDHRIISHQILNDVNTLGGFFVHNGFKISDRETLRTYYKKILEVQDWFIQASEKGKKDILVGYSFTGTDVIKNTNGGAQ